MATVLQTYWSTRGDVDARIAQVPPTPDMVWWYGELTYRIGVLETCQMFCRTAPVSTDVKTLLGHYQMLDAYIRCLTAERQYGPDRGPDTKKEREAAQTALGHVVQSFRKRFSSFKPETEDYYRREVEQMVNALLPVWLQFRNTFVPLIKVKGGSKS